MINSYCRVCGLYISVPDEYARGSGSCPRCKTSLRIPVPVSKESPLFTPDLRYFAEPARAAEKDPPAIPTEEFGPSARFVCRQCGERFESLRAPLCLQGKCPQCGCENAEPSRANVTFPRKYGPSGEAAGAFNEADMDTTPAGESHAGGQAMLEATEVFFVASPAQNAEPSDSVVKGIALTDDEAAAVADPTPHEPTGDESVDRRDDWSYLLKGEQHGPVTTAELRQLLRSGRITRSVLVWHEGMDGWQPIDRFDVFDSVDHEPPEEPAPAAGPITLDREAGGRRTRRMTRHCETMLWGGVAAACVVLLLYVVRQTLGGVGRSLTVPADIVMAVVTCGGALAAVVEAVFLRRIFARLSLGYRVEWVVGLGLLLASGIVSISLAGLWHKQGGLVDNADVIAKADSAFEALTDGDVSKTLVVAQWSALKFNGRDIGAAYSQTNSPEQRKALVGEVVDGLRKVLAAAGESPALGPWVVERREIDRTILSRTVGAAGRVEFTIKGGMLVGVRTSP